MVAAVPHPLMTDSPKSIGSRGRCPLRGPGAAPLAFLIFTGLAVRLLLSHAIGLGIDESYMVAAGRVLRLGYFDHPPLAWWLSSGMAHLAGSEAAWVVRLPFIALFALSTWLMYQLTATFYGRRAALWAALAFNLSPVFGLSSASWVLPDGPLLCALLGMALCLVQGPALRWWLGAGFCAGLALLSKYTAVLPIAGVLVFLATTQPRLLARPQPWLAVLVAALVFSPVLLWNAQHGWISFAFQGGRAGGARLNLLGPLTALGGEALFVLPWLWLPMMATLIAALRAGPTDRHSWLLAWLALGPIVLFALLALGSPRILFHWAAPGYLFLFPLLGRWLAARTPRRAAWATAGLLAAAILAAVTVVRLNPWPLRNDPGLQALDWTPLRAVLAARGLLAQPIAAPNWSDTGKVDYALGGHPTVFCLNPDARQYLFAPAPAAGQDILIIAPRQSEARIRADYASSFASIEALPPALVDLPGRPQTPFGLYLGRTWLTSPPAPR